MMLMMIDNQGYVYMHAIYSQLGLDLVPPLFVPVYP